VLDWQADGIVHEVKLTDRMEEAHEFQLLYYLYYLKKAKNFSRRTANRRI
jgi:CRISPR/Cas system-associated exonuclease Cas4 (RecB family)